MVIHDVRAALRAARTAELSFRLRAALFALKGRSWSGKNRKFVENVAR